MYEASVTLVGHALLSNVLCGWTMIFGTACCVQITGRRCDWRVPLMITLT